MDKKDLKIHQLRWIMRQRNFNADNYQWQKVQLKDGSTVEVTELKAGGICMVGKVPAAPGVKIELADGRTLCIGMGGIIGAVLPKKEGLGPPVKPKFQTQRMVFDKKWDEPLQRLKELDEKISSYRK